MTAAHLKLIRRFIALVLVAAVSANSFAGAWPSEDISDRTFHSRVSAGRFQEQALASALSQFFNKNELNEQSAVQYVRYGRSTLTILNLHFDTGGTAPTLPALDFRPQYIPSGPREELLKRLNKLELSIHGADRIPLPYLERMVDIVESLKDPTLVRGLEVRIRLRYVLLALASGIMGFYAEGSNRIGLPALPMQNAYIWAFSHELMHRMIDRSHRGEFEKAAEGSWKPLSKATSTERLALWGAFAAAFWLALPRVYGIVSWLDPNGRPVQQLVLLALAMGAGMAVSNQFHGMVYAWRMRKHSEIYHVYIFDVQKAWSFLSFYSLVSPDEEIPELWAGMMTYPGPLRRKMASNEALKVKVEHLSNTYLKENPDFSRPLPWESPAASRKNSLNFKWLQPLSWLFVITILVDLFTDGHVDPWGVFFRAAVYYVVLAGLMQLPALWIRIRLSWLSRKLPEGARMAVRGAVAMLASILFELQKLAIISVMAGGYFMIFDPSMLRPIWHPNPIPWKYMVSDAGKLAQEIWHDFEATAQNASARSGLGSSSSSYEHSVGTGRSYSSPAPTRGGSSSSAIVSAVQRSVATFWQKLSGLLFKKINLFSDDAPTKKHGWNVTPLAPLPHKPLIAPRANEKLGPLPPPGPVLSPYSYTVGYQIDDRDNHFIDSTIETMIEYGKVEKADPFHHPLYSDPPSGSIRDGGGFWKVASEFKIPKEINPERIDSIDVRFGDGQFQKLQSRISDRVIGPPESVSVFISLNSWGEDPIAKFDMHPHSEMTIKLSDEIIKKLNHYERDRILYVSYAHTRFWLQSGYSLILDPKQFSIHLNMLEKPRVLPPDPAAKDASVKMNSPLWVGFSLFVAMLWQSGSLAEMINAISHFGFEHIPGHLGVLASLLSIILMGVWGVSGHYHSQPSSEDALYFLGNGLIHASPVPGTKESQTPPAIHGIVRGGFLLLMALLVAGSFTHGYSQMPSAPPSAIEDARLREDLNNVGPNSFAEGAVQYRSMLELAHGFENGIADPNLRTQVFNALLDQVEGGTDPSDNKSHTVNNEIKNAFTGQFRGSLPEQDTTTRKQIRLELIKSLGDLTGSDMRGNGVRPSIGEHIKTDSGAIITSSFRWNELLNYLKALDRGAYDDYVRTAEFKNFEQAITQASWRRIRPVVYGALVFMGTLVTALLLAGLKRILARARISKSKSLTKDNDSGAGDIGLVNPRAAKIAA